MEKQQEYAILDIPVPVLIGTILAVIWSFFVVTYLLTITMDALRS